jgi:hypothetical protein
MVDGKFAPVEPYNFWNSDNGPGRLGTPFFAAAGKDAFLVAWRTEPWVGRGNGSPRQNALLFDAKGVAQGSQPQPVFSIAGDRLTNVLSAGIVWDGAAFVAAWAEFRSGGQYASKGYSGKTPPHEGIMVSRIGPDRNLTGAPQFVSGTPESPATFPAVASGGTGTTLIAYEKHPERGDVPIKMGVRVLTAK